MQEFAEQYIDELKAKDDRYDTRLGDDFFVCTFPNGVKTWVFVYEVDGYKRRRTLGIYPDMSLAEAREVLYDARKLQKVEEQLLKDALTRKGEGGARAPQAQSITENATGARTKRKPLLDTNLFSGLAAGTLLTLSGVFAYTRLAPEPSTPANTARLQSVPAQTVPTPAPARIDTLASATDSTATTPAPAELAPVPPPAAEPQVPESMRKLEQALAGTVARELLTSGVRDDKPVDELREQVLVEATGEREIFYFTEVRGMPGQTLTHRWTHNNELVASYQLICDERWRMPLYSSTRIDSQGIGHWQVELLDAAANTIEKHSFTVGYANAGSALQPASPASGGSAHAR